MSLPKKILISYDKFPPIAFDLQEAFEKLGIEAKLFLVSDYEHWFYRKVIRKVNKLARNLRLVKKGHDLFLGHPSNRLNYLSSSFQKTYERFQPDLVFFIHGQPYANHILTNINVPKIAWWVEPCDDLNELRINAEPFDIYNSFNQKAIDLLNEEGFPTGYLRHSVNPRSFYPITDANQNYDVAFVGNWSPWREEVLKTVLSVTKNVALYGPHWKKKSAIPAADFDKVYKGKQVLGAELNQLFNSAKVVLNASRTYGSSGLNMRFFEVPASGTCFLTDLAPELERHFIPEQHLSVFTDLEDLALKVNQLLENNELRDEIRKRGHSLVLQNYTYHRMVKHLLDQYESILIQRGSFNGEYFSQEEHTLRDYEEAEIIPSKNLETTV
jgi:glycosyltransferase involved in cell wall biosynthesis